MLPDTLLQIVTPVREGEEGFQQWSEHSSFFGLLSEQLQGPSLVLYGSSFNHGSLLIKSILVPMEDLDKVKPEDMTRWDSPYESWSCGLVYGGGQPPRLEYSEPLSRSFPDAFRSGQQLVFGRSFSGRTENKEYYEIAHFLTHAHDLHWTLERSAWCRLDENGNVGDVISWSERDGRSGYGAATCIAIDREVMEMQMSATGTALVQMFEVACIRETSPVGMNGRRVPYKGMASPCTFALTEKGRTVVGFAASKPSGPDLTLKVMESTCTKRIEGPSNSPHSSLKTGRTTGLRRTVVLQMRWRPISNQTPNFLSRLHPCSSRRRY
jgi:hypothetical protein